MPAFVEELVRMLLPLQRLMRRVTRDVELGGERILAGASVRLLPGSANRDSATWPDPDRLDLDHDNRRHLGFGTGIHVCPGASLARLEASIAFAELLNRNRAVQPEHARPPTPTVGYRAGRPGRNHLPPLGHPN